MCLAMVLLLGVLPWVSLAAAWLLSGQLWLGGIAMVAGGYLGVTIVDSIDRWLSDTGR